MAFDIPPPILYILMRTDLDSLNPGKAMAQACHAANCAVSHASGHILSEWQDQTPQDFGTTIVLDGGTIENIRALIDEIDAKGSLDVSTQTYTGVIHDPTYPIRDGAVTHLIPLDTCGYVFTRTGSKAAKILEALLLHP